jgi:membrane associated rhomboid family serine protease
MLLLGDNGEYHGRFPWVTVSLVVANVAVFVAQSFLGEPFTNGFSLVPAEITSFQDFTGTKYHKAKVQVPGYYDRTGHYHRRYETKQIPINHYTGPFPIFLTLFTSMFLHANLIHLIGNMWFFLIFGRNVECALNHGRFLAFYVACGICAGLAHVASAPHSVIPCLGASGAISGVMGAYLAICPFNKIKIWLNFWLGVIEVPALVVIGLWFIIQYLAAFSTLDEETGGGVAYWAHLGGFTAGFIIIRCVVFYLRRQQAQGLLTEEEPLTAKDELLAAPSYPPETVNPLENSVKAGEPDPFATFLSVRVARKLQAEHAEETGIAPGAPPKAEK